MWLIQMKKIDLAGQKFNRLTVIRDDGTRNNRGEIDWLCKCDCGNFTRSVAQNLKKGYKKSCGCLNDELKRSRFKDLTGTENENFKVVRRIGSENQRVLWECECKHCGNLININSNNIDHYVSCGCKRGADKGYMDKIRDPETLKRTKPTAKSSTGVRGVYFSKSKGRYIACINVDKKQKYLGSSKDFNEVVKLRRDAEKEFGYK